MNEPRRPFPTLDPLALIGPALRDALNGIELPAYVVGADGTMRWVNRAAAALLGESIGRPYLSFIACEQRDRAKLHFARKVVGGSATTYEISVFDRVGRRVDLVVCSAPLRERGQIVGTFELAVPSHERDPAASAANPLTPRQTEVLLLLARGFSTQAIAASLGVADETARNHIRAVLRRLEAHTRLEAVAEGRRRGLLRDRQH